MTATEEVALLEGTLAALGRPVPDRRRASESTRDGSAKDDSSLSL
jgi:hypothetical protein